MAYLIEGIRVDGVLSALVAAAVLGIVNAVIRPVVLFITLPVTVLTLGLFTFVVNALMLMLAARLVTGFEVQGFLPALVGSLLLSVISALLTTTVGKGFRRRR